MRGIAQPRSNRPDRIAIGPSTRDRATPASACDRLGPLPGRLPDRDAARPRSAPSPSSERRRARCADPAIAPARPAPALPAPPHPPTDLRPGPAARDRAHRRHRRRGEPRSRGRSGRRRGGRRRDLAGRRRAACGSRSAASRASRTWMTRSRRRRSPRPRVPVDDGTLYKPVAVDTTIQSSAGMLQHYKVKDGDTLTGHREPVRRLDDDRLVGEQARDQGLAQGRRGPGHPAGQRA